MAEQNIGKSFNFGTLNPGFELTMSEPVCMRVPDTIAAATLQMSEVKDRYRQSLDFSGRDQVRQALNAALKNLPSWPPTPQEPLM